MKNLNLCEILKGHEGETFYSPCYGYITLKAINPYCYFSLFFNDNNSEYRFTKYGKISTSNDADCVLFPSKNQRDWNKWVEENKKTFDGRHFSNEAINWKDIKVGDVVLEGDTNFNYRTITNITGNNWEYVDDNGYYHETKPDYCHWKVCGQKGCNGKLIKISIGEGQKPKIPKTWSELVEENKYQPYFAEIHSKFSLKDKCIYGKSTIEKSAASLLKIHQLIEVGYGGNVTNEEWEEAFELKYVISCTADKIFTVHATNCIHTIAFHTKEQAEEFLKYPENVQLLKDYFMI